MTKLDKHGREINSGKKVAVPVGLHPPETLAETIKRLVGRSIDAQGQATEMDTFEEADDFDIPDDPVDPSSVYETVFDPILGKDISHEQYLANKAAYDAVYAENASQEANSEASGEAGGAIADPSGTQGTPDADPSPAASAEAATDNPVPTP